MFTDSEESQWVVVEKRDKIDYTKFRIDSIGRREQSLWRRKITPPKISVRDLISRFLADDEEANVEVVERGMQTDESVNIRGFGVRTSRTSVATSCLKNDELSHGPKYHAEFRSRVDV